jgi:hypothetical protein
MAVAPQSHILRILTGVNPPGAATVRQWSWVATNGGDSTVNLGSTPVPGNILVCMGAYDDPYNPYTLSLPAGVALSSYYYGAKAGSGEYNGTIIGSRTVVLGDGKGWKFSTTDPHPACYFTGFVFEVPGASRLALSTGFAGQADSNGDPVALTSGPPGLTGSAFVAHFYPNWNVQDYQTSGWYPASGMSWLPHGTYPGQGGNGQYGTVTVGAPLGCTNTIPPKSCIFAYVSLIAQM